MAEWYYIESGQTRGPVDDEAIRVLASVGRLTAASQLMQSGSSQWSTLGACEVQLGLFRDATGRYSNAASAAGDPMLPPPPPPPSGSVPPPPSSYGVPPPGYAAPPPGYGMATSYRSADGPVTVFGKVASKWWKRAVALIIDTLLLAIPLNILTAATGGFEARTVDGEARFEFNGPGPLIGIIVTVLYYAVLNGGEKGQTLGKMAMRIQVRDIETGGAIGFGRGVGRQLILYVFAIACVIPLILDYLSPLWDSRRQAWHDKVVRSVVVDLD